MGFVHSVLKHLLSKAPFVRIKEKKTHKKSHLAYSHWPVVSKKQLLPGMRLVTEERQTNRFFLRHFKKSNTFSQQHNAYWYNTLILELVVFYNFYHSTWELHTQQDQTNNSHRNNIFRNLPIPPLLLNKHNSWHPISICFPFLKYGRNMFCFIFKLVLASKLSQQ